MIIVSQDKTRIINFNKVEILGININDNTEVGCDFNNGKVILGKYRTEERAKEVLQEIIRTKSNFEYYKCTDESERNELDPFMKTKYNFFNVYEMPEE